MVCVCIIYFCTLLKIICSQSLDTLHVIRTVTVPVAAEQYLKHPFHVQYPGYCDSDFPLQGVKRLQTRCGSSYSRPRCFGFGLQFAVLWYSVVVFQSYKSHTNGNINTISDSSSETRPRLRKYPPCIFVDSRLVD